MPLRFLTTAIILATAWPALAQPGPTAQRTPSLANVVAGIAVTAGNPPRVVSTYPAQNSEVTPGVLVLKVAFDQPMTADTWNYAEDTAATYPACLGTPRLLADGKTFVLLCSTTAATRYGVAINTATPDDKGFVNAGDRRSPPFHLGFSTSSGDPVRTVKAAMKAAGLGDLDMPVESLGAFVRSEPRP